MKFHRAEIETVPTTANASVAIAENDKNVSMLSAEIHLFKGLEKAFVSSFKNQHFILFKKFLSNKR